VARALFEIALRKGLCSLATTFLRLARSIDRRVWWWESPLRQLATASNSAAFRFPDSVIAGLEKHDVTLDQLLHDMDRHEAGQLVNHTAAMGAKLQDAARSLPRLEASVEVQPVTRQILRVTVTLAAAFHWAHGSSEPFWVWCGDSEHEHIYHSEHVTLTRKQHKHEPMVLCFTIPVAEPLPAQYQVGQGGKRRRPQPHKVAARGISSEKPAIGKCHGTSLL
jgi:activating signal cointegrator complex subunit 3